MPRPPKQTHAATVDLSPDAWRKSGFTFWVDVTPAGDPYAACATGYCPQCQADRIQTNSGWLMGVQVVTLHDEQGQPVKIPVQKPLLFCDHLVCATCGTQLTARPGARTAKTAKRRTSRDGTTA